MPKPKKKLTPEQKRAKKRRKAEFRTVFINGKQKRVRREPTIDGLPIDEFIRRNADPIWLHQNEMWECVDSGAEPSAKSHGPSARRHADEDDDIPF